jgi:hypothetical protein
VPVGLLGVETERRTLMDRRGEGVPLILERSERLSGRRPEYRLIDDQELLLIIFGVTRSGQRSRRGSRSR